MFNFMLAYACPPPYLTVAAIQVCFELFRFMQLGVCSTLGKAQLQRRQGRNKQADVTLGARRRCIFRKYMSIALETVLKLFGDLILG